APAAGARIGARVDDAVARLIRVRGPHLAAVQHVAVALADGGRADRASGIGPAGWLADRRERRPRLLDRRHDVALDLLLAPSVENDRGAEPECATTGQREGEAVLGGLLGHHHAL